MYNRAEIGEGLRKSEARIADTSPGWKQLKCRRELHLWPELYVVCIHVLPGFDSGSRMASGRPAPNVEVRGREREREREKK